MKSDKQKYEQIREQINKKYKDKMSQLEYENTKLKDTLNEQNKRIRDLKEQISNYKQRLDSYKSLGKLAELQQALNIITT